MTNLPDNRAEFQIEVEAETLRILEQLVEIASTRKPIQGEFIFTAWNSDEKHRYDEDGSLIEHPFFEEKEGFPNCGTHGCICGGFLPLIEPMRFEFKSTDGGFIDRGEKLNDPQPFELGEFFRNLNYRSSVKGLGDILFTCYNQYQWPDLLKEAHPIPTLEDEATQEEVLNNLKFVVSLMVPISEGQSARKI